MSDVIIFYWTNSFRFQTQDGTQFQCTTLGSLKAASQKRHCRSWTRNKWTLIEAGKSTITNLRNGMVRASSSPELKFPNLLSKCWKARIRLWKDICVSLLKIVMMGLSRFWTFSALVDSEGFSFSTNTVQHCKSLQKSSVVCLVRWVSCVFTSNSKTLEPWSISENCAKKNSQAWWADTEMSDKSWRIEAWTSFRFPNFFCREKQIFRINKWFGTKVSTYHVIFFDVADQNVEFG